MIDFMESDLRIFFMFNSLPSEKQLELLLTDMTLLEFEASVVMYYIIYKSKIKK